jgi:hypothetical protein
VPAQGARIAQALLQRVRHRVRDRPLVFDDAELRPLPARPDGRLQGAVAPAAMIDVTALATSRIAWVLR